MKRDFASVTPQNVRLWCLLAFQAGAVNAGGFIACHRFVTHTTGFATHFAFEFAQGTFGAALGMLSVPLFFLLGSMFTAYFVDLPLAHERSPNYRVPVIGVFFSLALATLLGELGAFGLFAGPLRLQRDYSLLVLLCLASGLQNSLIVNARGMVVRTTHLTGLTTDLGVGIVRILWGDRNNAKISAEKDASIARFAIIASFVLGSLVAAVLFLRAEYLGFLLPLFTSLILVKWFSQ